MKIVVTTPGVAKDPLQKREGSFDRRADRGESFVLTFLLLCQRMSACSTEKNSTGNAIALQALASLLARIPLVGVDASFVAGKHRFEHCGVRNICRSKLRCMDNLGLFVHAHMTLVAVEHLALSAGVLGIVVTATASERLGLLQGGIDDGPLPDLQTTVSQLMVEATEERLVQAEASKHLAVAADGRLVWDGIVAGKSQEHLEAAPIGNFLFKSRIREVVHEL